MKKPSEQEIKALALTLVDLGAMFYPLDWDEPKLNDDILKAIDMSKKIAPKSTPENTDRKDSP